MAYWIKLYHEVLNDPKMGRLPDRLWRRVIECFLLAGELGEGGFLPAVSDMSWTLRCDTDELAAELAEIAQVGILELREDRWFVVKFEERQSAASSTERVRRYRETKMKRNVTEGVAGSLPNETYIDIDTDTEGEGEEETDGETDRETRGVSLVDSRLPYSVSPPPEGDAEVGAEAEAEDVLAFHRRLSGCKLNQAQAALLVAGVESLGSAAVRRAIREWLGRGHKPWNVEGILDVARNGWTGKGRDGPKKQGTSPESYLAGPYADIIKH